MIVLYFFLKLIGLGFAVDAKALNQSTVNGIFALQKGAIFFLNVREDRIRFWKFLLWLGLNNLTQTVAVAVQNLCHGAWRRQLVFPETLAAQLLQSFCRSQAGVRQQCLKG